jgi:basic amino acid/polyamine antiporter, APA family
MDGHFRPFRTRALGELVRNTGLVRPAFSLAMVFVLLTYGGWNETVYSSAELKDVQKNMSRALMFGLALVTLIYLVVNLSYMRVLGMQGIASSSVVAAALVERAAGPAVAAGVSAVIAVAALSTMNATAITGARSNYALGRDVALFKSMGRWSAARDIPRNAFLVQGCISIGFVLIGAVTRRGFVTLVECTAPVFWFFFLLVGISVFILRSKEPEQIRPFRVPLYPLTPLLFCAAAVFMFWAALARAGPSAFLGVAILAGGLPMLFSARRSNGLAAVKPPDASLKK